MIGALGGLLPLVDSQTPNGCTPRAFTSAGMLYRQPSGPHLVSRTGTAGRTECPVKEPNPPPTQPKECACIETAGLWPWKSASAKECDNSPAECGCLENGWHLKGIRNRVGVLPSNRGKRVGRCPGESLNGERKGARSPQRYRSWWK